METQMTQEPLPTLENPSAIPELTAAARDYRLAIDERLKLQRERELPGKAKVLAIMHAHKLTTYKDENVSIELKIVDEKVQVKIGDSEAPKED